MIILGIREKLRILLSVRDAPYRVALSFGVGVFIGMSPLLGLHTILGIAVAWTFKMNKFVTIAGVYITNPWTIVPIYTFSTWVGMKITGVSMEFSDMNWHDITVSILLKDMSMLLWPFIVGSILVGIISGIVLFITIYYLFKILHKRGRYLHST